MVEGKIWSMALESLVEYISEWYDTAEYELSGCYGVDFINHFITECNDLLKNMGAGAASCGWL